MPFFDFHIHPSLKAQLADPAAKPTPWDNIRLRFAHPDIILGMLRCQGINEIVDSQASLSMMTDSGMNLIAIALHPPEAAMMKDKLIIKIASEDQTHYIHEQKRQRIAEGDSYYSLLNEELDHLEQHLLQAGKKLKIIGHISEYDPADSNTIHAILNVEGPHAFYGKRSGTPLAERAAAVKANLVRFITDRGVRIFAMNIAHLEQNDFCNHAFGIQVFKPEPFFPGGTGISAEGLDLLLLMKERKILCDIKHCSLFARQQLFQTGWQGGDWPLVCTHAGLTGIHSSARYRYILHHREFGGYLRVKHYKPAGYIPGTSFNPSSINLYDDDVVHIIQSGGLIGLSLDQRILGVPDDEMMGAAYLDEIFEQEVISPGEREWFRGKKEDRVPVPDEWVLKTEQIETARDRQRLPDFHARHFLNQVFHLFRIARHYGIPDEVMATRICIGSDFDGMINPLDCCRNVTGLPAFRNLLQEHFLEWENSFEELVHYRISDFISPEELLYRIFYRNGLSFLEKWYT